CWCTGCAAGCDGLQATLRRVLHGPLDLQSDPGHASGQARRRSLRPARRKRALPDFRPPRTTGGLRIATAGTYHVWIRSRACGRLANALGARHATLNVRAYRAIESVSRRPASLPSYPLARRALVRISAHSAARLLSSCGEIGRAHV